MKAQVEEINSVQKRIKIECGKDDVNLVFDNVYKNVRKKAKIQGFRTGKAPLGMIRKLYGASVASEVADKLIRQYLFEAMESESIQPISAPVLETSTLPEQDKEYSFSAVIDLMPNVTVEGYKGLELSYTAAKLGEDSVNEELTALRSQQAKTQPTEEGASAKEGMLVTFDQAATIDGKEIKEMQAQEIKAEIGKQQLFPALEEALVGMKVGEEKEAKFTLPDNYNDKDIAGKEASVNLVLKALHTPILPELDDEFAKDLGLESLDELKTKVAERLEQQAEGFKRNQLESQIFTALDKANQFEVPPVIVDQVIDSMIAESAGDKADEKQVAELKSEKATRDRFREDAKARSRNTLMLHEIIKNEKLEVTDEDLEESIKSMFAGSGQEIDSSILQSLKKSMNQQQRENLLFKKAVDFVITNSTITEKPE
tara:strand:- start:1880 stop:3163 length:1284 start_codon:yes stop_codon:yes gene_type:complete